MVFTSKEKYLPISMGVWTRIRRRSSFTDHFRSLVSAKIHQSERPLAKDRKIKVRIHRRQVHIQQHRARLCTDRDKLVLYVRKYRMPGTTG